MYPQQRIHTGNAAIYGNLCSQRITIKLHQITGCLSIILKRLHIMLQYFTESVAWLQRLLGPYLQQYWFNYTSFLTWLDVMAQRITEDLFSLQEQLFGPQTQQYSVFFLRSLNSYLRSLFSTTAIIYPLASNVWNITCGQTCQTHNVSMTIPDAGTGVRLQSYSYCGQ